MPNVALQSFQSSEKPITNLQSVTSTREFRQCMCQSDFHSIKRSIHTYSRQQKLLADDLKLCPVFFITLLQVFQTVMEHLIIKTMYFIFLFFSLLLMQFVLQPNETQGRFAECSCFHENCSSPRRRNWLKLQASCFEICFHICWHAPHFSGTNALNSSAMSLNYATLEWQ